MIGKNTNVRGRNQSVFLYAMSMIVGFVGLSYASVPLYKLLCSTGIDGTPKRAFSNTSGAVKNRPIRISFTSSVADNMQWDFKPILKNINVVPGESALAFYHARNNTEKDIVGISTYSVVPGRAAQYFNKIQCFCFEEQRLGAKEEVDMPVFFYIDPEFAYDPDMKNIHDITLHYTFFRSKHQ